MFAPALKRLNAAMRREIDRGVIPGAVMLIHHHGHVVHRAALGLQDPQSVAPMRDDTIFRIYSMTKPIVSLAALMLAEEGQLSLTDPMPGVAQVGRILRRTAS